MRAAFAASLLLAASVAAEPVMPAFMRGRPHRGFLGHLHDVELSADANIQQKWATQRIDHFNPQDTRTFQQQYWTNDQYWKGGDAPVFIFIGGESAGTPALLTIGTWLIAAQQVGALLITTEHRFYGQSQPFDDLSTSNLRYLSSQQSLADLASLHSWVSAEYNLTSSNKWVCFGGSYSGALSAWFRLKYPSLVVGAVASSAPVLAELDFVEYLQVVTASLNTAKVGSQCTQRISTATTTIQQLLQTSAGLQSLATTFNLCAPPSTQLDIQNFVSSIAGAFMGTVQYNRDNFPGNNITIDTVCDMMVNGPSDPVAAYASVSNLVNKASPQSCLDISYTDMVAQLSNVSLSAPAAGGSRQWTYQTCVEFAFFQSTDGANQVFGVDVPVSLYEQQCVDIYGPTFTAAYTAGAVAWTNNFYGGKDVEGSEIIFPNGSIDPWHALGVLSDISSTETAVFIEGTAHCADVYSPSPDDLPSLTAARKVIVNQILKWVQ